MGDRSCLLICLFREHSIQLEMTPRKPRGHLLMAALLGEASLLLATHASVVVLRDIRAFFFAGSEDLAAHSGGSPPHQ